MSCSTPKRGRRVCFPGNTVERNHLKHRYMKNLPPIHVIQVSG